MNDLFQRGNRGVAADDKSLAHVLAGGRDQASGYTSYYAGMDATSRQKSALTTTHVQPSGALIVDIGSGTGAIANDLANLYPGDTIIGVDIDPNAIVHAKRNYDRQNLEFRQVEASRLPFQPGSVDVFHNSSVLHEFASYPPDPFELSKVLRALDLQAQALKMGGKLIVRDFVIPNGPAMVVLDVRSDDGEKLGPITDLSTASLLERFVSAFRCSVFPEGCKGAMIKMGEPEAGWARYILPHRLAAEFVLRKDYRERWEHELQEEYTYLTQASFEAEFACRNLRVIVAQEIHNPWIVSTRFDGQVRLFDLNGNPLPHVPTNFFIVGERVPENEGVRLVESERREILRPNYLDFEVYLNSHPGSESYGKHMEVIRRPYPTLDVVPWFEEGGSICIIGKSGFPRPITNARTSSQPLDNSSSGGYISETLSASRPHNEAEFSQVAKKLIQERAGLDILPEPLLRHRFFSSPGGIDEQVCLSLHQTDPIHNFAYPHQNYSNLSTSGTVRSFDAQQLLRSYQVGGMFEARLEIAAYLLLRAKGIPLDGWIGAVPDFRSQAPSLGCALPAFSGLIVPQRQAYVRDRDGVPSYLRIFEGQFIDLAADGRELARVSLEYVEPRNNSNNTITTLPIVMTDNGPYVGLELRDLPVPQLHTGSSAILTAPAFRLPLEVTTINEGQENVSQRLRRDFGLIATRLVPHGGKNYLSPGIISEVTYPHLAEVDISSVGRTPPGIEMRWFHLADLYQHLEGLNDLQTIQIVCRAAHAYGVTS